MCMYHDRRRKECKAGKGGKRAPLAYNKYVVLEKTPATHICKPQNRSCWTIAYYTIYYLLLIIYYLFTICYFLPYLLYPTLILLYCTLLYHTIPYHTTPYDTIPHDARLYRATERSRCLDAPKVRLAKDLGDFPPKVLHDVEHL